MPAKMQEAWRQLGMPGEVKERAFSDAIAPLASGQSLGTPEILFDRLEEKFVKDLESIFRERIKEAESREREKTDKKEEVEKEEVKKEEAKKEEAKRGEAKEGEAKEGEAKKEEISFEDFQSMDIRIGEIKSAEAIKGSNKLLKLKVDIGGEVRQVVAGIAQSYSMDDLVGTQVVVLVNLQPAKLFGIESQAMLLAADVAGRAVLLRPREAVETGTKVR
jgi:methionyl-tRNA synthetase